VPKDSCLHHQSTHDSHAHLPAKHHAVVDPGRRAEAAGRDAALELLLQQVEPGDEARVDQGAKDGPQDLLCRARVRAYVLHQERLVAVQEV